MRGRWRSTSVISAPCGSKGRRAFDHLQHSLSNDLRRIAPGRAQYTHLLDQTGSVADDIIVLWIEDELFDVMPNASNTSRVVAAIGGEDVTSERAIIAVQGPAGPSPPGGRLARRGGRAALRRCPLRMGGNPLRGVGHRATPARTASSAPCRRRRQRSSGRPFWTPASLPAGLGARDTLRLEAGLPTPRARARARASRPCRPNWAGWSVGPRATSSAAPRWRRRRPRARADGCAGVVGEGRQPLRDGAEVLADR